MSGYKRAIRALHFVQHLVTLQLFITASRAIHSDQLFAIELRVSLALFESYNYLGYFLIFCSLSSSPAAVTAEPNYPSICRPGLGAEILYQDCHTAATEPFQPSDHGLAPGQGGKMRHFSW